MLNQHQTESILKEVVFATLVIVAIFQAFALRGLYADGSFQLVNLLLSENARLAQQGSFLSGVFRELVTRNNEPSRFFTYVVTEGPTVIALRLGITNLKFLTYLFSSSILCIPLLFWGIGLYSLRKEFLFWPYLLMLAVVYFMSNFFSIGEYNLSYSLAACCIALTLRSAPNTKMDKAIVLIAALCLIMSYAATIFLGPLLMVCAFVRVRKAISKHDQLFWLLIAVLYLASAIGGLWGVLHPAHPDNFQQAQSLTILHYNRQLWILLISSVLIAINMLWGPRLWRDILSCALVVISGLIAAAFFEGTPFMDYATRAFAGLILFGFGIVLLILRLYGAKYMSRLQNIKNLSPIKHYIVPITAIFLALAFLDIDRSLQFRDYITTYSNLINTQTGMLRFESSVVLIPSNDIYGWSWTNPSLSLLLRKNAEAALVLDPVGLRTSWKPVDLRAGIPDMTRYGIQ